MAPSTVRFARGRRRPANPAYADPHYRHARARLLASKPTCAHCGRRPGVEADHQPPLSTHPHLLGGACTCELVASCAPCARRQGALLAVVAGAVRRRPAVTVTTRPPAAPAPAPALDMSTPGPGADVWDVPWLAHLRDVPDGATWPRLMSPPHPDAVGSWGADLVDLAASTTNTRLRWWQQLAAARLLEYDDDGRLCWPTVGLTVARQVGKSWLLAEAAKWRIHQGDRFGEPQNVLHTARETRVAVEVQERARRWARTAGDRYKVREANGNEQIELLADGSRWIIKAVGSPYGLSASLAIVDEAWDVKPSDLSEGIMPTLSARRSAQLLLVSTAHRRDKGLMVARRNRVIADPAADTRLLWLEWSAPADAEPADVATWRAASPHWDREREGWIEEEYRSAAAGEASDDASEPDPLESFRGQWLNVWPAVRRHSGRGEPIIAGDVWATCTGRVGDPVAVVIAINDNYGAGGAVAVAAVDRAGLVEVDGRLCDSREEAFAGAARFAHQYPTARTVVGITLRDHVPTDYPRRFNVRAVGAQEAGAALPLLRDLAARNRLRHHNSRPLDEQLHAARVYPLNGGGLAFTNNGARVDLIKAACWAVAGVAAPKPTPAIH